MAPPGMASNSAQDTQETNEHTDQEVGASTRRYTSLYRAAEDGDVHAAKALLEENALLLDQIHDNGKRPIQIAAHNRHAEIVSLLRENGASIDTVDLDGKTQLICEAESGNLEGVAFLIDHGANVVAKDTDSRTALITAAENGHLDIVKLLVKEGASTNEQDRHSRTPLSVAAKRGHLQIVDHLVKDCKAVIDEKQAYGRTPLMLAISNGRVGVVKYLLECGASISEQDRAGWTPLHIAVGNGHIEIVELLMERGAAEYIDKQRGNSATSLYLAAERGDIDMVKLLIKWGAAVECAQNQGKTPLLVATERGFVEIVKVLLESGASVNTEDATGCSPLLAASTNGSLDIVIELIQHEALVDTSDNQARTPLIAASKLGRLDIVKHLLDHKANTEAKQKYGRTPLMLALNSYHGGVARLLLSRGASVMEKDELGWTPLHVAAGSGDRSAVDSVLNEEPLLDDECRKGVTPLMVGVQKGFPEVVASLLNRRAECSCKDPDYDALLISAVRLGRFDMLQPLKDLGASVHARGSDGETLLVFAARWGYRSEFQRLFRSCLEDINPPENGKSLISNTFEKMKALCKATAESSAMLSRAVDLLMYINSQLQAYMKSSLEDEYVPTFAGIVYRVCRLILKCQGRNTIARLIASSANNRSVRDFYEEIEYFVGKFKIDGGGMALEDWRAHWKKDQKLQLQMFKDALTGGIVAAKEFRDEEDGADTLTLLQHASSSTILQKREAVEVMRELLQTTEVSSSIKPLVTPKWFISRNDVEMEAWGTIGENGSIGAAAKWLKTDVSITRSDFEPEQFEEIATGWTALSHPHVLRLFGACSVGEPCFFVTDYSKNGTLLGYLKTTRDRSIILPKLHEAAQGLQYLHAREIVHGKLVSDSILIGADLSARIGGFEESFLNRKATSSEVANGDMIWKAPELRRGDRPSIESDVYAFGVCILNTLTWGHPWREKYGLSFVAYLLQRSISSPPGTLEKTHWVLIKQMCAPIPQHRVSMRYVVTALKGFITAENEYGLEDDVDKDMSEFSFRQFTQTTTRKQLDHLDSKCKLLQFNRGMAEHICERLKLVYDRLIKMRKVGDLLVREYVALVEPIEGFFGDHMAIPSENDDTTPNPRKKKESPSVRRENFRKKQEKFIHDDKLQRQQSASTICGYHCRLDDLLDLLKISKEDPIRLWEERYAEARQRDNREGKQRAEQEAKRRDEQEAKRCANESLQEDSTRLVIEKPSASRALGCDGNTAHANESQKQASSQDQSIMQSVLETPSILYTSIQPFFQAPTRKQISVLSPAAVCKTSPWYLPLSEVDYKETDCIGRGAFGVVYRGVWRKTRVVVKLFPIDGSSARNGIQTSKDEFERELNIWHQLNHPHVVKLFGACHVERRYFVCEDASNGQLCAFLRRQKSSIKTKWEKLLEVALGVNYLHECGVIHNDIKGDNILVGADGKAKLADFGMSSLPPNYEFTMENPTKIGAVHWKAPEYLTTGKPSFASDIYSLAMCILEVITGVYPWGGNMEGAVVRRHLKKGNIPKKPEEMNDNQWSLILLMTNFDASRRVSIPFVIDRIEEIVVDVADDPDRPSQFQLL
ncbi:Tkl protein kinase, partial [Globisporangium splendens]